MVTAIDKVEKGVEGPYPKMDVASCTVISLHFARCLSVDLAPCQSSHAVTFCPITIATALVLPDHICAVLVDCTQVCCVNSRFDSYTKEGK